MKKITDLHDTRWHTKENTDEDGNRNRELEDYLAQRPLQTVTTGLRIGQYLIDLICFYVLIFASFITLYVLAAAFQSPIDAENKSTGLVFQLLFTLFYPVYYIFFEGIWQRTPGKFLTKTIVIDEYGCKPSFKQIVQRSFSRLVPFEAFSCLGGDHSYGWHDKWSDTFVVPMTELAEIKQLLADQEEKI